MRIDGGRGRGMTLIEVIIAMTILATVLLGMGKFALIFSRSERQSDARTVAVNLAAQRLSEVRAAPNYAKLDSTFAGTEASIPGFPGFVRQTSVVRTGGPRPTFSNDYKTITVVVSAPTLAAPVQETVVVAAP